MIDVIITTFNRLALFQQTMESFLSCTEQQLVSKIIITDDGSTDGTADYLAELQQELANVEIIGKPGERKGLIPRFNEAFAKTTAQWVCEFQDDVSLQPGWLGILLECLENHAVDFVSGYDGREHKLYKIVEEKYKLKPSAGFVQLLATRNTWKRWFPMKSFHPFPTPTVYKGKSIGSDIDCKIYRFRKNDWRSGVKYLIVPGLVEHHASDKNSTWRKPSHQVVVSGGGLAFPEIKGYWQQRAKFYQEQTVGLMHASPKEQQQHHQQRCDFLLPHLPRHLKTLDFGCGIGRYSSFFTPDKYLGVDICQSLLDIAKRENGKYQYQLLEEPTLEGVSFLPELFFTATVLQHNSDEMVERILESLAHLVSGPVTLFLYENTSPNRNKSHICFRSVSDYRRLVQKYFSISSCQTFSHLIHGEEHSLLVITI